MVDRFRECAQVARDGNIPITDIELITNGLVAIEKTGTLDRIVDKWNDLPAADRTTWIQFVDFFTPRILEHQRAHPTGAHAHAAMNEQLGGMAEWIVSQQENQQTNQQAMATIAATNAQLMDSITKLQTALQELTTKVNNTQGTTTQNDRQSQKTNRRRTPTDQGSYCWTHGFLVHKDHTSGNCRSKAPGHKDDATRTDTKGGNQTGKPTA